MQTSVLFMNIQTICTLNLRLLTLKVYITKNRMPLSPAEIFDDELEFNDASTLLGH